VDCVKYIDSKISSGICVKHRIIDGKQCYRVLKKNDQLKKGDLFTRDDRHYEWELFTKGGET
jgi:hypothetical protein